MRNASFPVDFAPDSKSVAAAGNFVKFRTCDTATGKFIFNFAGHQSGVTRLAWSPDGGRIATSSTDKTIRLWNPKTGKDVATLSTFDAYVNQVAFAPNGKYLLAASGTYLYDKGNNIVVKDGKTFYKDSTVRLYEADGQKELLRWKDDNALPNQVQFSPDSRQFYAGISDKVLWRWNVTDTKGSDAVELSKGVNAGVSAFVCSPDGRWLACYGPDYRVTLLERETSKKTREWALGEQFGSVAFAPDSRHLAVALSTGVVLILRLEDAKK